MLFVWRLCLETCLMLKKVNFEEQRTLCEIHINVPRIFLDSTTIMPRNRIRTTNNGDYSPDALKEAIKKCLEGAKVKPTAEAAGIPRPTLIRYVKKAKASSLEQVTFKQNVHLQVFKPEEEKLLAAYVTEASNFHYALTNLRARSLAFDFAQVNNIEVPASWKLNKAAGKDWLRSFMQQNKLSFRTPETVSLSRATSFNEVNVKRFFDNLRKVKEKYNFLPQDIYNLDETSCVTVHRPPKVIAPRGKRTVSQMTSGERGTLVTMVSIVGATGKAVPPFLIFPRVHYKDHMLRNAPPGSKGAANMSGWMISDLFLPVLEHFVAHERPSLEHPKLIVLDNHESHLSISGIDYARANGIILLTLHPHTSNKLQPLDVAVFKPFKTFFNQAADKWLLNHPGSTISIYEIAELVGEAFPKSFTPHNICSGFKKTGIEPFNPDVFGPEDYLCSYVTDREDASNDINISPAISSTSNLATEPQTVSETLTPQAGPSNSSTETPTSSNAPMVSPQEVRPHPKAGPRKNTAKRAKSTSVILTTTPEKKKLEEKHRRKEENAAKKKTAKERKILKSIFPTFDKKKSSKKKLFDNPKQEDSSESMDSEDVSLHDSDESFEDLDFDEVPKDLEEGSFSLVKICGKTKNSFRYYVCQIEKAYTCGYDVMFFKRVTGTFKFKPTNETGFVLPVDCIVNLPAPIKFKNGRFIGMFAFNYDFEEFSPLF